MDHQLIKKLAKQHGARVDDLIAMTQNTDPFYVGVAHKRKKANWFARVFDQFGGEGFHLRRLHYKIIDLVRGPNGKKYQNTRRDWHLLCSAATYARHLGLVSYSAFIDRRNPPPKVTIPYTPDPLYRMDTLYPEFYPEDFVPLVQVDANLTRLHSHHIEIWAEKSTMDDILTPLCQNYMVYLVSGAGFESLTHIDDLLKRVLQNGKPCRILYISDYDNAGQAMPRQVARNLEHRVYKEDLGNKVDIKLTPILLLKEHVKKYDLPSAPDSKQTELDALEALHPGEFERIVRSYLDTYIDLKKVAETKQTLETERKKRQEKINRIASQKFGDEIMRLQDQVSQLNKKIQDYMQDIRFPKLDMPEPKKVEEKDGWLFSSHRDYFEQLKRYKNFERKQQP